MLLMLGAAYHDVVFILDMISLEQQLSPACIQSKQGFLSFRRALQSTACALRANGCVDLLFQVFGALLRKLRISCNSQSYGGGGTR